MLFMGMTLTISDFRRVGVYPKAVAIGLANQIILLPLIGLAIIKLIPLEAAFAMGIMVIAASPGGAVSNLISHLSRGDTALSISLTACSSILTIISIPFIINWSLTLIMGSENVEIQLPIVSTIINIFKLTVLPVAIGMFLNYKLPELTKKLEKAIAYISVLIIVLALILIAVKLNEIGDIVSFVKACFWAVFLLNVATLSVGFISAKILGLDTKQAITISIETGMQNNVLGMAIATSPALLNNAMMAVPAGVYGLLMCTTAVLLIFVFRKILSNGNDL